MHEIAKIIIEDVLSFHNDIEKSDIPAERGLRDYGLLESAVNAPFQTFMGQDLHPDMLAKAAHLCYGLANNHPFVDGNKRAAVHTMLAYLMLNDVAIDYTQEDLYNFGMAVAMGKMSCDEIVEWIRNRMVANYTAIKCESAE